MGHVGIRLCNGRHHSGHHQSGIPRKEVTYVLTQSRSSGVFVVPEYRGNRLLDTIQDIRNDCPDLREVIRLDQWPQFLATNKGTHFPERDVSSEDPVMIQYTSGTTGFPKGALLHHKGLVNNAAHTLDRMQAKDGLVWLTFMPLFHTGGCVVCVLGAVAFKATQVLMEQFEPGLALELIEQYEVNAFNAVPTMLNAMLEHSSYPNKSFESQSIDLGWFHCANGISKSDRRRLGCERSDYLWSD